MVDNVDKSINWQVSKYLDFTSFIIITSSSPHLEPQWLKLSAYFSTVQLHFMFHL